MSKKFKIGDLVREGGPCGPISRVIDIRAFIYIVQSLDGMSTGWMYASDLYPYKERYEQLTLF